jgi:hypothetical protein
MGPGRLARAQVNPTRLFKTRLIIDELVRIAPGPGRLEVELRYPEDLAVRLSDNGIGIDAAVTDEGTDISSG